MHSIRSFAALVGEVRGYDEERTSLIHNRLKTIVARGGIQALPGKGGRTSAGAYTLRECIRAVVLLKVIEKYQSTAGFAKINARLDGSPLDTSAPSLPSAKAAALDRAFEGAELGQEWLLVQKVWTLANGETEEGYQVVFIDDHIADLREGFFERGGCSLSSVDVIRLREVLAPFVSYLKE